MRRVAELDVGDCAVVETDGAEEHWTQDVDVLGVEIPPGLAVAIDGAATVNVDVCTAELEEGRGVLVDLEEAIGLPVVGIIGE